MSKIGEIGELLVAQWLNNHGWKILYHRWYCRWGEIDLIAHNTEIKLLAFVEVKTRSQTNWDDNGLTAVNFRKQQKLSLTAEIFLSQHHNFTNFPCRFDVALVTYKNSESNLNDQLSETFIELNKPIFWQGYKLTLVNYLESAFESLN